ncbi:MAG: hypothetical protein QM811_31355 [Pirellulales bacterium]
MRISLVIIALCILSAARLSAETPSTLVSAKQPNIVFIFSDDHAYQAIGAYNDPRKLLETPHLDRIARGDAVRSLLGAELDLRAGSRDRDDGQIQSHERVLQQ